jgi:hypothetical protein
MVTPIVMSAGVIILLEVVMGNLSPKLTVVIAE